MNLSEYKEEKPHNLKRLVWCVINATVFRCLPGTRLRYFRNMILRAFGAEIPLDSLVYSSCKIWAPWNLKIGKWSCVGPDTKLYNKNLIVLRDNVVVSQGCYLCTASHDISAEDHRLITAPIIIEDRAWVASDAFVSMGVTIGKGAVVGARGCVFKDVEPWTVVGGNPAKFLKKRILRDEKYNNGNNSDEE